MNADPKTATNQPATNQPATNQPATNQPATNQPATNKPAAFYVAVSQHAFDVPAPGTLVTGVALAYAAVALGLAAHLLFSDGTPSWAAQDPAVSRVASPAIDPEALTAGYRLEDDSGAGAGYLEFVPTGE